MEEVTTSPEGGEMGRPADLRARPCQARGAASVKPTGAEDGFFNFCKKRRWDVGSDLLESIDCFGLSLPIHVPCLSFHLFQGPFHFLE